MIRSEIARRANARKKPESRINIRSLGLYETDLILDSSVVIRFVDRRKVQAWEMNAKRLSSWISNLGILQAFMKCSLSLRTRNPAFWFLSLFIYEPDFYSWFIRRLDYTRYTFQPA